jgi:hypothetical protein
MYLGRRIVWIYFEENTLIVLKFTLADFHAKIAKVGAKIRKDFLKVKTV